MPFAAKSARSALFVEKSAMSKHARANCQANWLSLGDLACFCSASRQALRGRAPKPAPPPQERSRAVPKMQPQTKLNSASHENQQTRTEGRTNGRFRIKKILVRRRPEIEPSEFR